MKPAFAQDLAFAEPEEDKNGGSHDKEANKDHPDFNFAAAGDFGCGDEAKRTVNNIKAKDPEMRKFSCFGVSRMICIIEVWD